MLDEIRFHTNGLNDNVKKVMTQTNYTERQAIEKLQLFNDDYMRVLTDYMGIHEKVAPKVKSVNQEIFRQIRTNLDSTMREYRDKHPVNIGQIIDNFNEADERQKLKITH